MLQDSRVTDYRLQYPAQIDASGVKSNYSIIYKGFTSPHAPAKLPSDNEWSNRQPPVNRETDKHRQPNKQNDKQTRTESNN